jgi:hypothetical protein
MEAEVLFEEVQGGNKKASDFFKVLSAIFSITLLINLVMQKAHINQLTEILFTGLVVSLIVLAFSQLKMVTQIRKDGIYVRFPPFQSSFVKYSWIDIAELYIRKYDPLTEYNGWGMKTGVSGRCFTIKGDTGIQLMLQNGSRVLIGTQKPDEILLVLKNLNRLS